jgi:hypothetical protein
MNSFSPGAQQAVVWGQICLKKSSAGRNYGESRLQVKWLLHYGDLYMIVYPLLTNCVIAIYHAQMRVCFVAKRSGWSMYSFSVSMPVRFGGS